MFKFAFSAALLVAATPTLAQSQPAQQQQKPAAAKARSDSQRVICQDVSETGSRIASNRVCMTAEQWKQQEQNARDETAQQQQRANTPD